MILEFENHNPKYVNSGTSWKVEFIHLANFIHYEKNSRDVIATMIKITHGQDMGCSGEERN